MDYEEVLRAARRVEPMIGLIEDLKTEVRGLRWLMGFLLGLMFMQCFVLFLFWQALNAAGLRLAF